jgi:hypothetical protein
MRIESDGGELDVLWLDLTPAEAVELRDALNTWDGRPHVEAEWHIHVADAAGRIVTITVGNNPRFASPS